MPDYKFVVLENHVERVNRSARSHAMRTALQQRSKGPSTLSSLPHNTSTFTAQSQAKLKGRFRLSARTPNLNSQIHEGSEESLKNPSSESHEEKEQSDVNERLIINDAFIHENLSSDFARAKYPISPFENQSMDPFDTLPAPSSKAVDLLTKYFIQGMKLNIATVNPNKTWIGFALTDSMVFHVTLAFAATAWNANIAKSTRWLFLEAYYHKGVAMHKVNEQINYLPHAPSDEVLCAVATLVNVETLSGSFDAANTHLKGLMALVKARGGIISLKDNFIIERAITWADVILAVSCGRLPHFPPIHAIKDVYLPDALVTLSNHSHLAGIIQQGPRTRDLLYILRLLRLIVIVQSEIGKTPELQNTVRVLMLRADRCILQLLITGARDPAISSLVRIANSACHVFLHRVLRNTPKNALPFHILLGRMREQLEQGHEHEFCSVGSSIVLLWALVIGVAATYDIPEQNIWFVSRLRAELVMFRQRYDMGRSQFEQRLNAFVGLEWMYLPVLSSFWGPDHNR